MQAPREGWKAPTSASVDRGADGAALMPTVRVLRLGVPSEDDDAIVGEGVDIETGERVNFVVPPEERLRLLADAHAGRRSVLTLHPIDIVPWEDLLGMVWDEGRA